MTALRYRPDIDGLRAVAVLLVVGYHAFPARVPGGFIGVDIFFVISGFLITRIIAEEAEQGRFTFTDFYVRRSRRIFPALAAVLVGTWLIGFVTLTAREFKGLGVHIAAGAAFASNLVLWGQTGYFDGPAELKPLLHLWSLGVEEQYYLVWPLLLFLLLKRKSIVPAAMGVMLVGSFALSVVTTRIDPSAAFYLLPMRFWELLTGGALGLIDLRKGLHPQAATFWAALGLGIIAAGAIFITAQQPYPGWLALFPVVGAALLIAAGPSSWINRVLLSIPAMVAIGLISYPLYLWHWPLLSIFNILKDQIGAGPLAVKLTRAGLVALSFVLAFLTYRLVELPAQRRLRSYCVGPRSKRRAIAGLVAAMGGVALLGGATVAANGLVFRHKVIDAANYQQHEDETSLDYFNAQLDKFPVCQGAYASLALPQRCYQSTLDRPDIAVIGDSHSISLFPGFADAIEKRHLGHVVVVNRCPPVLDVNVQDQPECLEVNRTLAGLLAHDPAMRTVVLTSRGPLYITGSGYGSAEIGVGKGLFPEKPGAPNPPAMKALFERGYTDMVAALEDAGKKVIFVVDVPELGFAPGECLYARPYQISAGIRTPCAIPAADVRQRQGVYREAVAAIAATRPSMQVFDASAVLCDSERCYGERDGRFLYTDSNHIGVYGSRIVGDALAAFMAGDDARLKHSGS